MSKTKHIEARMSQRAISQTMVDLARMFGIPHHDGRIMLNRKGVENLQNALRYLMKISERVMQKDGLVVVEQSGKLVTTYGMDKRGKK